MPALVVMYLYVHDLGESINYPTVRAKSSVEDVALRYLECAVAQAASLCLTNAACDVVLATNGRGSRLIGRKGIELLERIEALGVEIVPTDYRHRPHNTEQYLSSRYVLDAIETVGRGQPDERAMWLTDLDCIWTNPSLMFSQLPASPEIGCINIGYGPDWDPVCFGDHGLTRRALGAIGSALGASEEEPPWIGGELLAGTAGDLQELVRKCEQLDAELAERDIALPTEEQLLTLAGATGRVRFRDLSAIARRMTTGPRNQAARVEDPLSLGLWHLPSEKGLSLRRTAQLVSSQRTAQLERDFAEPSRAARRFNVAGAGPFRRIRDDSWLASQRLLTALRQS
jgi:hypothetical protein